LNYEKAEESSYYIKETDEAPEMDKCLSALEQIGD